jgi:hypothetical protein
VKASPSFRTTLQAWPGDRAAPIGDDPQRQFARRPGTHLRPPTELNAILRAIFDDDTTKHFSDQLAWFSKPDGTCRQQGLSYGQRAGTLRLNSARLPGPEPQRSVLVDLGSLPAVVRVRAGLTQKTPPTTTGAVGGV